MDAFSTGTPLLNEALCNAQAVMIGAIKDSTNPHFKSKYADISSVIEAIREPFADNGLCFTQIVDLLDNGYHVLITRLMHVSGEQIESKMLLPHNPNPQKVGAELTYFRRYSLMAIAGLPCEDDDGNEAAINAKSEELRKKHEERKAKADTITEKEWETLDTFLNGYDDLRKKLMELCNVEDLRKITKHQLATCGNYARQWIKAKHDSQKQDSADELDSDQPSPSDQ